MTHFHADDGEKIHLKISGSGSPLVMLHGWTASHQEWFPFLDSLHGQHTVYRWDARGHGGHDLTQTTGPSVERMARDLQNLLDHYQLDKVAAVGHSMGALTLWQYLRDFGSSRLEKVCFIDQSPKLMTDDSWDHGIYGDFGEDKSADLMARLEADFAEGVLTLAALGLNERARTKYLENAKGWERSRAWLRTLQPAPLISCWRTLIAADYRDVLPKIDIPSLLIYGDESNFYELRTAQHVASQIPNAILKVYERADHSPHQWHRERFCQDLLSFLA